MLSNQPLTPLEFVFLLKSVILGLWIIKIDQLSGKLGHFSTLTKIVPL